MANTKFRSLLLCAVVLVAANLVSEADDLAVVLNVDRESSPESMNRREQLNLDLERLKTYPREQLWQAGYIAAEDGWKAVEDLGSTKPKRGRTDEYFQKRQSTNRTSIDQLKLASWCLSNDLRERAEAHLIQSVVLAPPGADTSEQLKKLRYRIVGQKFVSPFDDAEMARDAETHARDLNQWLPRVSRLAATIKVDSKRPSGKPTNTEGIEHHAAVPAIEQVLASADEAQALVLVEALGRTRSYRATQTLASAALMSPSLRIRDAATAELRIKKKEDFVPGLLSLLRTPVEQQVQSAVGTRGEQFTRIVWTQEDATTMQMVDFRVLDFTAMNRWTFVRSVRNPSIRGPQRIPNTSAEIAKAHELRNAAITLDAWANRATDQAEAINERVNSILEAVSDSPNRSTPQDWWGWWTDFEDVDAAPKRLVVVKEEQKVGKKIPETMQVSCLVSGTPVWTEQGLTPIEQIQIGDRVLSKNVETGELALKPVLHTTYRPPRKTTRFEMDGDSIQATGGHRFWVSGSGWLRTRELAADQSLHTTTGTTHIAAVEAADEAATYNLVVADFHTYFVGKSGILSHDVLPPKPTNKVVPGLNDD